MTVENLATNLRLTFKNQYAELYTDDKETLIAKATDAYIPIEHFKELFNEVGRLTKEKGYKKLIFDKRNLQVFHQPSMVWYFVEWKEEMYDLGLTIHRKILPKDPVFRECVKLGREKIYAENPKGKFHQMDIQYSVDLDDALEN